MALKNNFYKVIDFLHKTKAASREQIIFMSWEDAKKNFISENDEDNKNFISIAFLQSVNGLDAYEGSISHAGYTFYFINPEKL